MRRGPTLMGFTFFKKGIRLRFWLIILTSLFIVRLTKGVGFSDAYAYFSRPFWPGPTQKEWIKRSVDIQTHARISLLEEDNKRLREMLSLKRTSSKNQISAPVIARSVNGWWQQIELGKGKSHGINPGDSVIGPGGLLGIIKSTTPITSRAQLLTAPGSRIGVWVARTKKHAMLIGIGSNRPYVIFLDKEHNSLPGDLLSTSPASTLLPPNIPVAIIQSIDNTSIPSPKGIVELIAPPEAIDWVQIKSN